MRKLSGLILLNIFVFASCNVSKRKIVLDNKFEIAVSGSFQDTEGLNKHAILELNDPVNNVFLVVLEETKEEIKKSGLTFDLAGYTKFTVRSATTNVSNIDCGECQNLEVMNAKATLTNIKGLMEGNEIYYDVMVVESDKSFYQLISWMPAGSKQKSEQEVLEAFRSFRVLN